jgi:hypothetical protein
MQALEKTKNNMSKYYDQHHLPQPEYEVWDEVLLNAKKFKRSDLHESEHPSFTVNFVYLPKLAKEPTDSSCKVNGESTTYSIPPFRHPIGKA